VKSRKILDHTVDYHEVDRQQLITLGGWFKLLQEVAIRHADDFDCGTRAMVTRRESWMLNRIALKIFRWPEYDEQMRVETWSTGIKGFRGNRDFAVFVGEELIARCTSLWIYINLDKRSITKVPKEIAANFLTEPEKPYYPELAHLKLKPTREANYSLPLNLRYNDIDSNQHINSIAYINLLQTALVRSGLQPHPNEIHLQYLKEIPAESESVEVRLHPTDTEASTAFSLASGDTLHAQGTVSY